MIQSTNYSKASFVELEKKLATSFAGIQKHYEKITIGLPKDCNKHSEYLSYAENTLVGEILGNNITFAEKVKGKPLGANQIKIKIQFGERVRTVTPNESLKPLFKSAVAPVLYQERLPIEKIEVFCHESAAPDFTRAVKLAEKFANMAYRGQPSASFNNAAQLILENAVKKAETL